MGVPCAPVNHILELLDDAQAKPLGAIETEGVPHVASPHRFHVITAASRQQARGRRPANHFDHAGQRWNLKPRGVVVPR